MLPDAGPLITLAYADALDLLRKPGWPVRLVDRVLHEVTRNATPTSAKIAALVDEQAIEVQATRTFAHYQTLLMNDPAQADIERKALTNGRNFSRLRFPP